ncbi:hypothetical protein KIN20_012346 [Parelaphostrongylus tenuis]|uniref:Uncharacterized protein n=1 Tax=Parelaphostrongylus tenuis TaxID=148309 RepID=A0AAD5QQD6_PARTN|nr:hypothetical protein KIN20_012346 [Parelaphostrongylus tenuis]
MLYDFQKLHSSTQTLSLLSPVSFIPFRQIYTHEHFSEDLMTKLFIQILRRRQQCFYLASTKYKTTRDFSRTGCDTRRKSCNTASKNSKVRSNKLAMFSTPQILCLSKKQLRFLTVAAAAESVSKEIFAKIGPNDFINLKKYFCPRERDYRLRRAASKIIDDVLDDEFFTTERN